MTTCGNCQHWMRIEGEQGACFAVLIVIDTKQHQTCAAYKEKPAK